MEVEQDSAQMRNVLTSALRLLNRGESAFAREMFFDASPASDVAMLTNPIAVAHSTTIDNVTFTERLPGMPVELLGPNGKLTHLTVMVPCYSSQGLTVGIVAGHMGGRTFGTLGANLDDILCGRFIRKEASGETVLLLYSLCDESHIPVMVEACRSLSATENESLTIVCDPQAFRDHRREESAVLTLQVLETSRVCPVCGRPSEEYCACVFPFEPLSGPLDYAGAKRNFLMSVKNGNQYRGIASMLLHPANVTTRSGPLMSVRMRWRRDTVAPDCGAVDMVLDAVVQMRMGTGARVAAPLATAGIEVSGEDGAADVRVAGDARAYVAASTRGRKQLAVPSLNGAGVGVTPSVSSSFARAKRIPYRLAISTTSGGGVRMQLLDNMVEPPRILESMKELEVALPEPDVQTTVPLSSISNDAATVPLANLIAPAAISIESVQPSAALGMSEIVHGVADKDGVMHSKGCSDDACFDDKALRLLMRKQRNREAAARSNAKRKERLLALRAQLDGERQEVLRLNRRADDLRRENEVLRRLVLAAPLRME